MLDKIKVVLIDTDIWSGRKPLTEADMKMKAGQELPPANLATLGTKLVMDPVKLAIFMKLKASAHRACLRVGVRFLNAYAIPEEKLDDLMTALAAIGHQFEAAKSEFLAGYQEALDEWVSQNAGWETIIKSSALAPEEVNSRLKFQTQVIEISPVTGHEDGLKKEISGLPGQLRKEIEQLAVRTWKESFYGRTVVTQKAIRPLRTMLAKIEGLMFLEPELVTLVGQLKASFASIPAKGLIDGPGLVAAAGILSVLGNIPEAVISIAEPEPELELELPFEQGEAEANDNDLPAPAIPAIPAAWF